jgi:hypothetical protein
MESIGNKAIDPAIAPAPIALFVYNRPWHTQQTLEALAGNELAAVSELLVFSDAPRGERDIATVQEVRRLVRRIDGFKSVNVVERSSNLGLAGSIIDGVTAVCGQHGRVIVLEDDLITAPWFLRYMNDALSLYAADDAVGSIHGYWYPVHRPLPATFFLRGASCWGWATWSRAWQLFDADGSRLLSELQRRRLSRQFDLDGAIAYTRMLRQQIAGISDSWAIRWHAAMFLAGKLQLSPATSLVRNIGFDGSGRHSGQSCAFEVELAAAQVTLERVPIQECADARAALIHYYRGTRRSLGMRALALLRRLLSR